MAATPNAVTPLSRSSYRPVDAPTVVLRLPAPIEEPVTESFAVAEPVGPTPPPDEREGPSPIRPLLAGLLPALLLALLVGAVAGRELAPYLGAVIGTVGAVAGLRKAARAG
jgi:hypothetical protein